MSYDINHKLNILYIGHKYGTSHHRAEALKRIGNEIETIDPWELFSNSRLLKKVLEKLVYETGAVWIDSYIGKKLISRIRNRRFDVIWSDQCTIIGPITVAQLKRHADHMLTYAIDDPFGKRDKKRFTLYRKTLNQYDLIIVVRQPNVSEAYKTGAPNVMRFFRSADEIAHQSTAINSDEKRNWASDVAFIGTWMQERGPFLARLLELGLPLKLYGDRWQKAPEWPILKKIWHGPNLIGKDYVKAIQAAKICLGLLSKGNRDLHTTRSTEIPYIGSVLCAERTIEHLAMYREDKEAVFWSSPEECAQKCFDLISDESMRISIARAGHERCLRNGYFNEPIMKSILISLLKNGKAVKPTYGNPGWCSR